MTRSIRRILAAVWAMCATACGDRTQASVSGIVVRDSAGVEIVEHTAAYIASLPQWTIDTAPLVHIAGDAPGNAFTNIREVTQRPDGRFLVVEGRAREIREYSSAGVFQRNIARGGRGPGEIESVSRLQLTPEDSLVVFDSYQRRASIFAPTGEFVRQVTYPRMSDGSSFTALGMRADKRLLGTVKRPIGDLVETDGPVSRSPYAVVRVELSAANADSGASATFDTIAVVPDLEEYPVAFPEEGKTYPEIDGLIFGRRTNIGVLNDELFVGTNVTSEIQQYSDKGVVRRIRSGVVPGPVTEAHRAAVHAELREILAKSSMPPDQKAAVLKYTLTQRRIASVFAFHETLTAGADSTLWVEAPRLHDQAGRKYVVHDAQGRAIARVEFPARIVPHSLSRDRMLGVWLDGDDVPHVILWKIVPGSPAAR
ncbi:MAG: hypothetical protein H7Z40_15465 [Phycisphaerae bacterium]|nr:hypothetical protein [Gemmatimonadaceae bacterium]